MLVFYEFLRFYNVWLTNFFFFSFLLLHRVSHASLRSVVKLCWWPVALNIAALKDYVIPISPLLL